MRQKKIIEKKYSESIKERKDGRQVYILINRKQIVAKDKESLVEKLWQMEYGRQNSSMAMLMDEWLLWKRDNYAVSTKTLKEYQNIWKAYLKNLEIVNIPMHKLTAKDFFICFRKMTCKRELTKKQFTNIKSLLNGIYAYAIETDIVSHNPIREVDCRQFSYKPVKRKNQAFTIEERNVLLEYLKDIPEMYALAIQLDFCLVLRIGELTALKWSDIEGDNIHIQEQQLLERTLNDDLTFSKRRFVTVDHIKGYSDQGYRYQPLIPKAKEVLKKIRELNPNGEYILMKDGKQLLPDTFNEYLKKYCNAVGIKPRPSHQIRFSTASILWANNLPLTDLQRMLGHTTTAMTLHYIDQVTPASHAVKIMESALA